MIDRAAQALKGRTSVDISRFALAALLLFPTIAAAQTTDRLVLLDGSVVSGAIEAIDGQGRITVAGTDQSLELAGLRRIERSPSKETPFPAGDSNVIVELAGGGRVHGKEVTIANEKCIVHWPFGDPLALSIDSVRAIRFRPPRRDADFEKALAGESEEVDRLFVSANAKLDTVRGLIETIDEKSVSFEWQGERTTVPREKLHGVIMAVIGRPEEAAAGQVLVKLRGGDSAWGEASDDTQLWGTVVDLKAGQLALQVSTKQTVSLPWNAVSGLTVRSNRLEFLSDRKPVEVEQQPIVAFPRPWKNDRSVEGNTLTVGGTTFDKGLGVSSYSRLVYDLDEQVKFFAATIGIDAETGGRGDCVFAVLGDGKELFRLQVRGKDPAHKLRLDVRGVKSLELIVEPGEDLDLADHADWADACLIRQGIAGNGSKEK